MVGIFPQARQAVGGLFDRIERATARPAFGLGIGLLSGSPQLGFENAAGLRRAREERAAQAEALRQVALQQATDNAFRTRALDIEAARNALGRPPVVDLSEFSDAELDAALQALSSALRRAR